MDSIPSTGSIRPRRRPAERDWLAACRPQHLGIEPDLQLFVGQRGIVRQHQLGSHEPDSVEAVLRNAIELVDPGEIHLHPNGMAVARPRRTRTGSNAVDRLCPLDETCLERGVAPKVGLDHELSRGAVHDLGSTQSVQRLPKLHDQRNSERAGQHGRVPVWATRRSRDADALRPLPPIRRDGRRCQTVRMEPAGTSSAV